MDKYIYLFIYLDVSVCLCVYFKGQVQPYVVVILIWWSSIYVMYQ